MNLSQINDLKLIALLKSIAQNDGGENPEEIDKPKGYNKLCRILNGSFTRELEPEEKDVLMGLKIEYENKYLNTAKNSNNRVDKVDGNYVVGDGNAVGGDNSTNVSGNNNVIGNNNNIYIIHDEDVSARDDINIPKIDVSDVEDGEYIATRIYDEIKSNYALNGVIKETCLDINKNNAYSFVKKYYSLNQQFRIMQDIYSISDIFNRITIHEAVLIISSLLEQANDLGLCDSPAYINLDKHLNSIRRKRNKDPSKEETIRLDSAIELLMREMAKKYNDKI